MWYVRNLPRVKQEEASVDALRKRVDWLTGIAWTRDGDRLAVDAVITAHGHVYAVRMTYPAVYPDAAPAVRPATQERWSPHQYGAGGTLCLEYSGDTWSDQLTGADMLESAHRLLDIENPKGAGGAPAPSRHELSQGQELRGTVFRLLIRPELLSVLYDTPERHGTFERVLLWGQVAVVILAASVTTSAGTLWTDEQLPADIQAKCENLGLFIKTDAAQNDLNAIKDIVTLDAILGGEITLKELLDHYFPTRSPQAIVNLLLLDTTGRASGLLVFLHETEATFYSTTIIEAEPVGQHQRLPESLAPLTQKRVGIVGLGSVGSKLALTLARVGLRRFYLLDEDLLLPENLQRHALDYSYVGQHKTTAVVTALKRIVPDLEVQTSEMDLVGQENNALIDQALTELGKCNLIIDATASPDVFRVLTSAAITFRVPIAWGKVFGGGIGGLIARSRPNRDPSPRVLNHAFLSYCENHPFEGDAGQANYSARLGDGLVVAASDIEVGIVAHHLALMVVDTLTRMDDTRFPHALYLLGLQQAWVFEQPFHVIPISPQDAPTSWEQGVTESDAAEAIQFLVKLLQNKEDRDNSSAT